MMRQLFNVSTILFFLAIGGFWMAGVFVPEAPDTRAEAVREVSYTLQDVARHATGRDCWMAIRGQVYDFTPYVPQHPADPSLFLAWCGKEATRAYLTKTKGRPHSPYADQTMLKYRIGTLRSAN